MAAETSFSAGLLLLDDSSSLLWLVGGAWTDCLSGIDREVESAGLGVESAEVRVESEDMGAESVEVGVESEGLGVESEGMGAESAGMGVESVEECFLERLTGTGRSGPFSRF